MSPGTDPSPYAVWELLSPPSSLAARVLPRQQSIPTRHLHPLPCRAVIFGEPIRSPVAGVVRVSELDNVTVKLDGLVDIFGV